MSRGSTFTLYRAYNNFKIGDDHRAKILEAYYDFNKNHDWGLGLSDNLTEEKKNNLLMEKEKQWKEDVPLILNLDFDADYHFDREKKKDENLEQFRQREYANFALKDDGRFCDKLLEWNFTSSFDCLIEHYHLSYYNFHNNAVIIDKETAKEMLSAIEYLLGGKWDDTIEMAMNNPWIKIFSEGGNCDSYWKYVYRKRAAARKKTYRFSDGGVEVVVNVPRPTSKKSDEDDDEDEMYIDETSESNETAEFYMRNTANALRAFLESDNWSYENDSELVLVYSAWG